MPLFSSKNQQEFLQKFLIQIDTFFLEKKNISALIFFCILLIIFRRPDALMNAQFWAEDGMVWFSEAFNFGGFQPMLHPQNGYFQTISRLGAWLAIEMPLLWAPFIMNSIAIIIRILPLVFLWHPRFHAVIPSSFVRLVFTIWYVIMPSTQEIYGNITNAHWILSLYGMMILTAKNPQSLPGKIHDILFILLAGFSGPFALFLFPAAFFLFWQSKEKKTIFSYSLLTVLSITTLIQAVSIAETFLATRVQVSNGASFLVFIKLLATKLFGVFVFGHDITRKVFHSLLFSSLLFISGMGLILHALVRGKNSLRAFILFSSLMLFAALWSPMVSEKGNQWVVMGENWSAGSRYFVVPMVVFMGVFLWNVSFFYQRKKYGLVLFMLFFLCLSAVHSIDEYRLKPYKNLHWKEQISYCEEQILHTQLPCIIPINPDPSGWYVHFRQ